MDEYQNFPGIDVDRLLKIAEQQVAQAEEAQKALSAVVGRASDADNLVHVEFGGQGLRELELRPKAMRLGSEELAEKIKATIQAAVADHQARVEEAMVEVYGEEDNPMRLVKDPDAALDRLRSAEAAYNRTFDSVMGELTAISRRLDL
ncbi:YbaB/EbfC family nucleoid-associated protein [Nonomuraea sp. 3-1Str]|uniref:YbaB/EbfC family nucleoid-associated protein n=1 Tax=Nonomuraea sp. 3-1Str TaxID=2929801 RepID=UPI002859EBF4|nr:YbaB/EbfC family nucleoid-associated protein [Nonomuraea sp. 3-1Str]MDR8408569.1 YbaB/EbfC family nucleoid-associated protein [Nonomuraea sp. 3-1Str]